MKIIFTKITLFFISLLLSHSVTASDYQDWWWNPGQSGMGINVGQQGNMMIVAWYLYGNDGQPHFLTLSGTLRNDRLEGTLTRSTGPLPGPGFNSKDVGRTPVGTASLTFHTENTASFSYHYEGKSGTIPLQRFQYDNPPLTGKWLALISTEVTGCTNPRNNGNVAVQVILTITQSGPNHKMHMSGAPGSYCNFDIPMAYSDHVFSGHGHASCYPATSTRGPIKITSTKFAGSNMAFINYEFRMQGETCLDRSTIFATRQAD